MNKTASPELYQELERMSWPGNVRELENVMERLVITNGNETILPEHPVSRETGNAPRTTMRPGTSLKERSGPTRSGPTAPAVRLPEGSAWITPPW